MSSDGFGRLAGPYRWMEYLSFGHALERCRFTFLPELGDTVNALLLGDGDGRFAEQLLRAAPRVHVYAVDGSAGMLRALQRRCAAAGQLERTTVHHGELPGCLSALVPGETFDLVATHFFLDCLSDEAMHTLTVAVRQRLRPGARWILSDFHVPDGPVRLVAQPLVRSLYAAFHLLTGLRVTRLPDHVSIMRRLGFQRKKQVRSLCGMLVAELWQQSG